MKANRSDILSRMHQEKGRLFLDGVPYCGTLQSENKVVNSEKKYVDGKLNGIQKKFYKSGEIKEAALYTDGKKRGCTINYYKCGAKKMSASYCNGFLDGILEEWDQSGLLTARKVYCNGKLIADRKF